MKNPPSTSCLKCSISCLRRISHSERGKRAVLDSDILEWMNNLIVGEEQEDCIIELLLAFLVVLTLRNTTFTRSMVSSCYFESLLTEAQNRLHDPEIQRQFCMLIRNCAVQNFEMKVQISFSTLPNV